jgi:predicted NUDIX family NTP pyrophosphohydrolase
MVVATMPAGTHSAGILLYRRAAANAGGWELLLAHPGGPYWAGKRAHAYGVPKGEYNPAIEDAESSARREFREETGQEPPSELLKLGDFETKSNKVIHVWIAEQGTLSMQLKFERV